MVMSPQGGVAAAVTAPVVPLTTPAVPLLLLPSPCWRRPAAQANLPTPMLATATSWGRLSACSRREPPCRAWRTRRSLAGGGWSMTSQCYRQRSKYIAPMQQPPSAPRPPVEPDTRDDHAYEHYRSRRGGWCGRRGYLHPVDTGSIEY